MPDFNVPNIVVVAGESSGDVQGAKLVAALKTKFAKTKFEKATYWGIAGPCLREQGVEAFVRTEDTAVMGFWEVAKSYLKLSNVYKRLRHELLVRKPAALIVIDYPTFNLKLIQDAYAMGVTVFYHIPPKVWAHGVGRLEVLKRNTHLVTSILPFETEFFRSHGLNSVFVGNPLKDAVNDFKRQNAVKGPTDVKHIGLFPGSRVSEIDRHVDLLVKSFATLVDATPGQKFAAEVAVANTLDFHEFVGRFYSAAALCSKSKEWVDSHFHFEKRSLYHSLALCDYAWVCSGTAALETAFFGVPNAVFYRTSPLTFAIGKAIVDLKYVSLTNLCVDRPIVPEFLQHDANVENLVTHAHRILNDVNLRMEMVAELKAIEIQFPLESAAHAADAIADTFLDFQLSSSRKFHLHLRRETEGPLGGDAQRL